MFFIDAATRKFKRAMFMARKRACVSPVEMLD